MQYFNLMGFIFLFGSRKIQNKVPVFRGNDLVVSFVMLCDGVLITYIVKLNKTSTGTETNLTEIWFCSD